MEGRRGLKRACSDDDEPDYTPKKKRGRPRKSLAPEQTPEHTPRRSRGRPPGSARKSLAADLSPEQTPAKTPKKAVNFVGVEEHDEPGATPQSYFRVKEGSGVSKRLANKITDIGIVEEQDLRDAIAKLSPKHEKEQAALVEGYRAFYHKWYFQLRCGFGLLMYGFGSKKKLLEDFASSELRDGAAVAVNGYLSNVNIKHVVYTVAHTLWEAKKKGKASNKAKLDAPVSSSTVVDLLGFLTDDDDDDDDDYDGDPTHVYVIIHNIDGPGLRDDDVQQTLASLANSRHVRLVASIDNINAPILWDKQMARNQFKWLWLHTPTYAAYKVEGTGVPLLLGAGAATKSARSAILVLRSLTPNAQSVFRVLGEFQISHPEDQGLPLNRLYTACREQFLVSSEVTLRAHLTEFKDHELLKFRRGGDGQDCLYIPLPNEALSKLLQDITS